MIARGEVIFITAGVGIAVNNATDATKSGKESFDHPTGRHNDMGIGWELSIHGCIQLGLKIDMPGNHTCSQIIDPPEINCVIGQL